MQRADTGDAPGLMAAGDALAAWHARGWLPAVVLEVGARQRCHGRVAIGVDVAALFDLASLTKVLATGLLAANAVQDGRWSLDDRVATWVPDWQGADRAAVTIRDLLTHASGLPAHLPLYATAAGAAIVAASARAELMARPRAVATYSDLGFIVAGDAVARACDEDLAAATHRLLSRLADRPPTYRPGGPAAALVPTGDSAWRGHLPPGAVHDDNAAAMGGVAGHAGLFGDAAGVGDVARTVLDGLAGRVTPLGRPDVLRAFTRRSPVVGSSRALAWDTALPTSSSGPALSARAIGHTGFTGTSLWIDPALDLYVVLLTNRVAGSATATDMSAVRQTVHTIIATAWQARHRA